MGLKKKLGTTILSILLVLSMVFVHPSLLTAANAEETYGGIEFEKDVNWGFENSTTGMSVSLDVPSGNVNSKASLLISSNDSAGVKGYSINGIPCSGSVALAVQCLKQGTYTVSVETLFSSDGNTYSDTCTVIVLPSNANGVQLTAYEHTMQLGEQFRIYGVFAQNKRIWSNVQFTSSDPKVATVAADGTITAVAPGQTDIIASSNGYTAKCAVTVQGIQFEYDTHWERAVSAPSSMGNRIYYTAEVPAGSAYSIESSNPNVVSENAGNYILAEHSCSGEGYFYIKGLNPGTATLTIRTSDGKYMDACTVVVVPRNTTGVCLSAYDRTMQTGDKFKLDASYVQNGSAFYDKVAIQFTSSNPNAAVVAADGTITAVAPGQADIIATMGGYTAKCVVTVPAPVVEAASVALNTTSLTMVAGDKVSLSATVSPASTTDKAITWTSGNTSVAAVDANGQVTAKAAGTTTITATTSNGKTATCTVTVYHYTRTASVIAGGTVWLGKPNEVVGGDQLRVKNNGTGSAGYYTRNAYAKFYIAGMEAYAENNGLEIESVRLVFSGASSGQISANRTVYVHEVNSNSWKESTLKYSNAPAIGQQIGSAVINGKTAYGTNYTEKSIDVTDYILSKMESGDAASVAFTVSTCGGESIMIPKDNVRLVAVYKMAE